MAMPDSVLDMRFAHFLGDFADDEGFLNATYQAAIQVERKKALKAAKEATKTATSGTRDTCGKEEKRPAPQKKGEGPRKNEIRTRRTDQWEPTGMALKGVPQNEIEAHKKTPDGCW